MRPSRAFHRTYTISQASVQLSAQCPVRFASLSVKGDVRPHDHEFYEICFVLSGTARHRTSSGTIGLSHGDVLVLPVGAVHAFERPHNLKVVNGYYLGEWLLNELRLLPEHSAVTELFLAGHLFRSPAFRQPRMLRLSSAAFESILVEVNDLIAEAAADVPSPLFLRSALVKLLLKLQRSGLPDGMADGFAALRPAVQRTIDEIERHLEAGESFSVEAAGRSVGLSAHHLSRVFSEQTGWSPSEYFQRRRIQVACGLLLNPELPINEIVHELGFSDGPHFSRIFRAWMKRTPREYRRLFNPSKPS